MPLVPGSKVTPQVSPSPFQSVPTAPGTFAISRGLGQLGQGFTQLAAKLERDAEEDRQARAKELDVLFRQRVREIEFGTADTPGYFSTRGRVAVDSAGPTQQTIEDARQDMLQGIEDPDIREMFNVASGNRAQSSFEGIDKHRLKENEVAKDAASLARMTEISNDTAILFGDDDAIIVGRAQIRAEVFDTAERNGWSQVQTDNALNTAMSAFFKDMITHAATVGDDVSRAKELFAEFKSQIDPGTQQDIDTLLDNADQLASAQKFMDDLPINLSREEAIERAKNEPDANLRALKRKLVNFEYDDREEARQEILEGNIRDARSFVQAGGRLDEWERLNIEDAQLIKAEPEWQKLLALEELVQEGREHPNFSEPSAQKEVFDMDQETIRNSDPLDFKPVLDPQAYQEYLRMRRGAVTAFEASSKGNQFTSAMETHLKSSARGIVKKWDNDKISDKNRLLRNQLRNRGNAFVQGFIDRGETPSDAEIQAEANRLVQVLTEQGSGFFGTIISTIFSNEQLVAQVEAMTREEQVNFRLELDTLTPDFKNLVKRIIREESGITVPTTIMMEEVATAILLQDRARGNRALGGTVTTTPDEGTVEVPRQPLPQKAPSVAPAVEPETKAQKGLFGGDIGKLAPAFEDPKGEKIEPAPQAPQELVQKKEVGAGGVSPTTPEIAPGELLRGSIPGEKTKLAQAIADNLIEQQLIEHEGFSTEVYEDSEGIPTIGVGFNLNKAGAKKRIEDLGHDFEAVKSGKEKLTRKEVMKLFREDIKSAEADARSTISTFDDLTTIRQQAFIDMAFNLGKTRLSGFKKMIVAIKENDFETAADEAKDSKWFKQVGRRGPRIVALIRGA